jgi:hypothetical protein
MKWTIDKGPMPSYLRVETGGAASSKGFAAMWDEILASNVWHPGLTVLIDHRNLKPPKHAEALTRAGIDYFAKNAVRIGKACISMVSARPEDYKYARQFQYGSRLHGCDVVLQLFGTETQAIAWLNYHYSVYRTEHAKAAGKA